MVEEARLEELDSGLAPLTEGWFVVNVRDAAWLTNDAFGARCVFEADGLACGGVCAVPALAARTAGYFRRLTVG